MKILEFSHGDFEEGWEFPNIHLKNLNLFVGASGAGKTKMLNALFTIGTKVVSDSGALEGFWHLVFEHEKRRYAWDYVGNSNSPTTVRITKESIREILTGGAEVELISRTEKAFKFKGVELPKLSSTSSALYLLREDPAIRPAYSGFTRIMRRNFSADELPKATAFQEVPSNIEVSLATKKSLETLYGAELSLSTKLYLLKNHFRKIYDQICDYYKSIFPFVDSLDVMNLSDIKHNLPALLVSLPGRLVPVLVVKEKKVAHPIPIQGVSSGMQKVLLILTDILSLPGDNVYLIDEYENSLGINAINFLPSFILEHGGKNQFVITSHHPYLINAIPIQNWFVFHRSGSKITIRSGTELTEKYGKSKQAVFTQLINDPFYIEGVE